MKHVVNPNLYPQRCVAPIELGSEERNRHVLGEHQIRKKTLRNDQSRRRGAGIFRRLLRSLKHLLEHAVRGKGDSATIVDELKKRLLGFGYIE